MEAPALSIGVSQGKMHYVKYPALSDDSRPSFRETGLKRKKCILQAK